MQTTIEDFHIVYAILEKEFLTIFDKDQLNYTSSQSYTLTDVDIQARLKFLYEYYENDFKLGEEPLPEWLETIYDKLSNPKDFVPGKKLIEEDLQLLRHCSKISFLYLLTIQAKNTATLEHNLLHSNNVLDEFKEIFNQANDFLLRTYMVSELIRFLNNEFSESDSENHKYRSAAKETIQACLSNFDQAIDITATNITERFLMAFETFGRMVTNNPLFLTIENRKRMKMLFVERSKRKVVAQSVCRNRLVTFEAFMQQAEKIQQDLVLGDLQWLTSQHERLKRQSNAMMEKALDDLGQNGTLHTYLIYLLPILHILGELFLLLEICPRIVNNRENHNGLLLYFTWSMLVGGGSYLACAGTCCAIFLYKRISSYGLEQPKPLPSWVTNRIAQAQVQLPSASDLPFFNSSNVTGDHAATSITEDSNVTSDGLHARRLEGGGRH